MIEEADRYMQKGNYRKAEKILKRCLKNHHDDVLVLYNLGVVYYKAGRYTDSIYSLEEAIRLGGEEPDIYNQLGLSCDRNGDREGAAAYYTKALEKDTEFPLAWNNRGVLSFLSGDYTGAYRYFKRAVSLDPQNPDTWYNLRDTCRELGFEEEAENADARYREFVRN